MISPLRTLAVLVIAVSLLGCDRRPDGPDFVARVGDSYLLKDDVDRSIAALPWPQDTVEARNQIIEQWMANELLFQEAQRRNLRQDEEVRRLLQESERSVLVNALVSRIYEDNPVTPSNSELQAYFERHKEQLRLRESFARVRYLEAATLEDAEEARRILQASETTSRDSVWIRAIEQLASDVAFSSEKSFNFFPEGRLFAANPALRELLGRLREGEIGPVVETNGLFYVVQLVERVNAHTIPESEWIEDELMQRLVIEGRKQLYARHVQRLRNEALAREDLELR